MFQCSSLNAKLNVDRDRALLQFKLYLSSNTLSDDSNRRKLETALLEGLAVVDEEWEKTLGFLLAVKELLVSGNKLDDSFINQVYTQCKRSLSHSESRMRFCVRVKAL
jgi:hypothetical protein